MNYDQNYEFDVAEFNSVIDGSADISGSIATYLEGSTDQTVELGAVTLNYAEGKLTGVVANFRYVD